jgi:hypothetical protein
VTRKSKEPGILLPMGLPLVIAKDDGDIKAVAEAGLPLCYILGSKPGEKKDDPAVARIYKAVKSMVGMAIVECTDDDLDLLPIQEHCWWHLPPIPRTIVRDLDHWFRLVDDKLGTEAIALLTFDPAYKDAENEADGWGVLVPKQSNTAGSCRYDPASVADEKEDGVIIVGSVHSHPGMSAFASHTDVKDQADFDGIHITYGWKGKSKVTEYHVELQAAGGRFNYTPDQAFEPEELHEPGERVAGWLEKVEKEKPAGYAGYGATGQYQQKQGVTVAGHSSQLKLPKEIPANPRVAGIIIEMMTGETTCPACKFRLDDGCKKRRRCSDCMAFLSLPQETLDDVITARWDNDKLASPELDVDKQTKGIYFWKRWKEAGIHNQAVQVYKERVDVIKEPVASSTALAKPGESGKG